MALHYKLSGILRTIVVVLFIGFLAWAYQVTQSPPPKICGSPDGPPITAPRIKLRDGRHLAYKEHDVPRDVDRNLASVPKPIEVVKISFPRGLFLIAIS